MELMFRNSLRYNTDKKSRIVLMTKRLKEFFLDKFQNIVKVSATMDIEPFKSVLYAVGRYRLVFL
jgi:hypothetical protein